MARVFEVAKLFIENFFLLLAGGMENPVNAFSSNFGVESAGANKVRDAPPELGRVAFHLDQGSAKGRLFLSLRQRLLEQAAKTVLLTLDPQEILNLLPRTCAWDFRIQKRSTNKLSAGVSRGLPKSFQPGEMFVPHANADEMA